MSLTVRAPAKINLYLRVFPGGDDGFHPLRSWFRTIDLQDQLEVTDDHHPPTTGVDVSLTSDDPAVPTGADNLVSRAFHAALGRGLHPLAVHLQKRIPAGAGLGGGSSDAAAALVVAAKLKSGGIARDEMSQMALQLGADVPFFLRQQLDGITDATCTGRGEIVRPFKPARRHTVLLILPELHLSTAAVYRQFDELPAPWEDDGPDFAAWSALPALELLPLLRNDLEPAAFSLYPELARLRHEAETRLGRSVRMTGSGSALFTLYDPQEPADHALDRLAPAKLRPVLA